MEIGLNRVQDSTLGRDLLDRVRSRLVDLLAASALAARERAEAGDVLAQLGDPRFRPMPGTCPTSRCWASWRFRRARSSWAAIRTRIERRKMTSNRSTPSTCRPSTSARYPVTVAQFRAYLRSDGAAAPEDPDCLRDPPTRPCVGLPGTRRWTTASWLTETLRGWDNTPEPLATLLRTGDEDGRRWHVTLPSEAEWEKGGTWRVTVASIPWQRRTDRRSCQLSYEQGSARPAPSAAFPLGRSPYELEDMAGNRVGVDAQPVGRRLAEADLRLSVRSRWTAGRTSAPSDDVRRVLRGGSFVTSMRTSCAARPATGTTRTARYGYLGFRVVPPPFPLDSEASGL